MGEIMALLGAGAVGYLGGVLSVLLLACLASSRMHRDKNGEGR